jgi:hypothetical protein
MGNFDLGNASPEVVKEVKRDIVALERILRGGPVDSRSNVSYNFDRTDVSALKDELIHKKKWLDKYEAKKLTGDEANKAFKRVKELREKIQGKLQPKGSYYQFYPTNQRKEKDFQTAVTHEAALLRDRNYKDMVREYRALMMQLDPEDMHAPSIEALRPGKNVRVRR